MHNPILLTAICAVVSFFIGAIPFGLILGRVFNHTDIRKGGLRQHRHHQRAARGRPQGGRAHAAARLP